MGPPAATPFAPTDTLIRLALALAVGLFVGLEREWRGKEAGLRTFGLVALLGALGGLLGEGYALVSLALLGVLVIFLNVESLRADEGVELTTSAALMVTGFTGVLCGLGHTFTPVAVAVSSAALLAWKERLAVFSIGLTAAELRGAILLALLAFVVYPVLPTEALDPWGLVQPRSAWVTVILIAAIGFANYVLLKLYGARGIELTGFLGGLVNSTVTVTELALRVRETEGGLLDVAYRGVLLATAAMTLRNAVLLGILAPQALVGALLPLLLMLALSAGLALVRHASTATSDSRPFAVQLQSPFSLQSALRFGLIFILLQVAGTVAELVLGQVAFYAVSLVGGFVSSASAVASAATLASQAKISPEMGGTGAALASIASVAVNLILVSRVSGRRALTRQLGPSLLGIAALGLAGLAIQAMISPVLAQRLLPPAS